MKAILHYNSSRDQSGIRSRMVAEKLAKEGVEVLFDSDFYGFECAGEKDFETADVLITLGGDGTVLTAAQVAVKYGLPVLGINLGNLGYLTAFDYSEADTAVRLLLGGKLETERRALLETTVGGKTFAALNEICVISGSDGVLPPKVATFSAYSDGEKICAETIGSSIYSISAGSGRLVGLSI